MRTVTLGGVGTMCLKSATAATAEASTRSTAAPPSRAKSAIEFFRQITAR
jgi:hypothetical protein